jgi:serine phosphatase RsbU (regulator of sigma subunit)
MLKNYAVYYEPKDIVSGDFYWYHEKKNHFYLGVADCTGHGVPGALLTMLGTTYLNEIITPIDDISPADFLDELRKRIIQALSYSEQFGTNDGMDISLLKVNSETLVAEWSGANNPIWIVRKTSLPMIGSSKFASLKIGEHQLIEFKADKQPIGKAERILPFKNHRFQLEPEDVIYMFSDGFADQFGGRFDKKYKTMNFKRLILENQQKNIADQLKVVENVFFDWKGNQAQVDDVCVFAFQI